jgi:DNA-binding CsgD family transcriptional regulator/tetratricopeptide (TPR) repeat protein
MSDPVQAERSSRGEEPLLEREAELEAIEGAVAAATAGRGGVLVIEGQAGLGKSRLMGVVTGQARISRMLRLRARPGRFERDFPFGVVRQLFGPVLAGISPRAREELLSGAAALAAPLFDDEHPAAALRIPDDAAYPALHGLHWLTVNLAARRPVLIAIDDAHWADLDSLRFLAYVSRRIEELGVLVAVAARPGQSDERGRMVDELVADSLATVLRPRALSPAGSATYVRRELAPGADDGFCLSCHEATGGNPYFLHELVSELAHDGIPPRSERAGRVPEVGPQTVARAVLRRLGTLPLEPLALARAVAVLGDDIDARVAGELAGLDPAAAAASADRLARVEIFRPGQPLAFAHPIVRTAIYQDVPTSERSGDHARAAALLVKAGAPPDQVAAHLLETEPGADPETVAALRAAAGRAEARGAAAAAVPYLRRALAEPPSDDERGGVLAELGAAELHVDPVAAAGHLGEALDGSTDARERAELTLLLSRSLILSDRLAEAVDLLEQAIAESPPTESRNLSLRLEAELITQARLDRATVEVARERLAEVRDEVLAQDAAHDESGEPVRLLLACMAGEAAIAGESSEDAARLAERALEGYRLDEEHPLAFTFAASALTWADRFDAAAAAFEEALRDARGRGSAPAVALISCWRSPLALRRGAIADAEEDARTALDVMGPAAWGPSIALPVAFLVDALLERGESDEAWAALEAHDLLDELPDSWRANLLLGSRARLRAVRGDTRGAIADLRATGERHQAWGIRNPAVVPWRSQLADLLGPGDEAASLAAEELELARTWGAPRAIGRALRAQAAATGDPAPLDEAIALLEDSPATLERAAGFIELGALLRTAGRNADAREPLRHGIELAHRCGALALGDRGHEELVASGARPRRTALTGVESLTPSERRVAALAADGMTNRQIAETLFVTEKTVELHLSATYKKLDIKSRSQLPKSLAESARSVDPTAVEA